MMSSGYGYRRDPFSQARSAMHSGIDFKGPHVAHPFWPPRTAKVNHLPRRLEIGLWQDHRNYAWQWIDDALCSSFANQRVTAGQKSRTRVSKVGAMGSTGRSTGTHLAFRSASQRKSHQPPAIFGGEYRCSQSPSRRKTTRHCAQSSAPKKPGNSAVARSIFFEAAEPAFSIIGDGITITGNIESQKSICISTETVDRRHQVSVAGSGPDRARSRGLSRPRMPVLSGSLSKVRLMRAT